MVSSPQSCDLEMDDEVHNFRFVGTNARPNHINTAAVFIVGDNPAVRNVSVVIVLILKLPLLQIYNLANRCFSRQPIVRSFPRHSSRLGRCNTGK
jgi:hypothetical protein